MNFDFSINGAVTNDVDLSCECQGLITDFVFRATLEHYARIEIPIYAIYIPQKREYDIYRWIPINIKDNTLVCNVIQLNICNDNIYPKIIKTDKLEGEKIGEIYCHAVGTAKSHQYINRSILSYEEAQNEFNEKFWLHMKIG